MFPGSLPLVTLQGKDNYDSYIDSAVFRVANALKTFAESPAKELGFGDFFGIGQTPSTNDLNQIEGLLSMRFKKGIPTRNYDVQLPLNPITPGILREAY